MFLCITSLACGSVEPATPFGCPNTLATIRNKFSPPPDGRNFLLGECGSFLKI